MRIPDLTQRVVGYRRWTTNSSGQLLPVGTTQAGPWKPGPQHAQCWVNHGGMCMPCLPVADPDYHCGFYAIHRPEDAYGYSGDGYVQGIVTGWGRLAVHERGFRAEWIEIMAIIVPNSEVEHHGSLPLSERVPKRYANSAKYYNVPLIEEGSAETFASEFGSPVPQSLYPKEEDPEEDEYGFAFPGQEGINDLLNCRGIAKEAADLHERLKDPRNRPLPEWLLDVMNELDPSVPEAMAGLYDIYVPNSGDLLTALNYPPVANYIAFPEAPIIPWDLTPDEDGLLLPERMGLHIATTGHILYLPTYFTEEDE